MREKILNCMEKRHMVCRGDHIIIGLSGGVDSVCLFHFLLSLREEKQLKLTAVHVHHGLRAAEADRDYYFAEKLCFTYGVDYLSYHYDIKEEARKLKVSVEEAGRMKRYEAFNHALKQVGGTKIALAHHKNDMAETLLIHLTRGTGLKGLGGIPYKRDHIIRPLLDCAKTELEQYARDNNFQYCQDSTNNTLAYTRNKVRHKLIPLLESEFNPAVVDALWKTGNLLQEDARYMEGVAAESYRKCRKAGLTATLDIKKLLLLDPAIGKRLIRMAIEEVSGTMKDIGYGHIEFVWRLLEKQSGSKVNLPHDIVVQVQFDSLTFAKREKNTGAFSYDLIENEWLWIPEISMYITLSNKIKYSGSYRNICTLSFSCDKILNMSGNLSIRNRLPGDKIFFKTVQGHKKLNKLLMEKKIPQKNRDNIPLIAMGHEVLCVLWETPILSDAFQGDGKQEKIYIQIWEDCA